MCVLDKDRIPLSIFNILRSFCNAFLKDTLIHFVWNYYFWSMVINEKHAIYFYLKTYKTYLVHIRFCYRY